MQPTQKAMRLISRLLEEKGIKKADMKDFKGKRAIPFNLSDSNGHAILLDNYKGSWLLMVFHRHLG